MSLPSPGAASLALSKARARGRVRRRRSDDPIVVFGDGRDWHGRSLLRAFKLQGLTPIVVPLGDCGFDTQTASGLHIPGLGDRIPRGAFVRFVPGGSFEQVTLHLGVLHALRTLGTVVWNDARAIERCVDKSTTTFFLQREGLPTPQTWTGLDRAAAEAVTARLLGEGRLVVEKPLFGAQGKGLRLVHDVSELAPPEEVNGVYYLQEFIPAADGRPRDWRLFVCNGRVVAAMIRHGLSWITNIKQGARPEAAIPSQEIQDLALRATSCVGADYAGVDIIQAPSGAFLVLEVNSMPAWNGLQQVSKARITRRLVTDFLDAALGPAVAEGQEGA
jgi:tetrahydromethanopterin:alpha-L-glutamate ligase